jgi:uncharacterized membrane protein
MKTLKCLAVAAAALSGCTFAAQPGNFDGPSTEAEAAQADVAREEALVRPVAFALPGGAELVVRGSEPEWSAVVSAEGIVVTRPDGSGEVVFPYNPPVADGRRLAYASSAGGEFMTLRISAKECTDPATGEVYPHTAFFQLNRHGYRGCARPGGTGHTAD